MTVLDYWLVRRFASAAVSVAAGLAGMFTVFDLLAHAAEVAAGGGGTVAPLVAYGLLRVPAILDFVLPLALLVAALRLCGGLASAHESEALLFAGYSPLRLAGVLAAVAAIAGVGQFVLVDRVGTAAAALLHSWEADGFAGLPDPSVLPREREWIESGNAILHIEGMSRDATVLGSPTLVQRDGVGRALRFLSAREARHRGEDGWEFLDVLEREIGSSAVRRHASLGVPLAVHPAWLASLNRDPEMLRLSELRILGEGRIETQMHAPRHYRIASMRRLSGPASGPVLVLLAVPMAMIFRRTGGRAVYATFALAVGFLHFIGERMLISLSEAGDLPPFAAVWGAHAGVGLLAGILLLRRHG